MKEQKVIGLIFIGILSITLLSIIGIGQGRMVISYGILSLALFLIVFYCKSYVKTKINLLGIILLAGFLSVFLLSYFYSPAATSEYGLWKMRQFVFLAFLPAFLILIVGKLKKNEMTLIENFILFACFATSLVVLYNTFSDGGLAGLQADWFSRQSIGEMNPVWLSRFLGLGLLVLQAPRFEKRPVMVFVLSIALVITALLTGSKTVLYFTLPIIVLYRLFNSGINKRTVLSVLALIGVVSMVAMFLNTINSAALIQRFSLESGTIGMRETMMQSTWNAFIGSGTFNTLFGHGGGTVASSMGYGYVREYPHNLFLEVLFELGLIGFFLLSFQTLLAILLFLKGLRNWVFFAYILHVLFSFTSGDLASNNLVFVFFALYLVSQREKDIKVKYRLKW
ncbi:O-antigen ligase family protein [Alteribacter populi]|uniref:O-antigen ligase family protein n=1 Tax=Alteribacter populi TaxID=2011011 RepID=UPI0012FF85B4|nr:O-antigen ligase family protein [Alteribacter populi]